MSKYLPVLMVAFLCVLWACSGHVEGPPQLSDPPVVPSFPPLVSIPFVSETMPAPGLTDGWYQCWRVIDGDTVVLANVGRLRFAKVNAAELGTAEGEAAKAELVSRIEGKMVRVEFVRRKHASSAGPAGSVCHDRYGRALGKVFSCAPGEKSL